MRLLVPAAVMAVLLPALGPAALAQLGSAPQCAALDPARSIFANAGSSVVFSVGCQDADGDLIGGEWYLGLTLLRTDTTIYPATWVFEAGSQIDVAFPEPGTAFVRFVGYDSEGSSSMPAEWTVDVRPRSTAGGGGGTSGGTGGTGGTGTTATQTARSDSGSSVTSSPPSCARVAPVDPLKVLRGDTPTFEAQCTDADADLARVEWFLDDVKVATSNFTSPSRGNARTSVALPDLARHEVKAVALDAFGQRSVPALWRVDVVTTLEAPTPPSGARTTGEAVPVNSAADGQGGSGSSGDWTNQLLTVSTAIAALAGVVFGAIRLARGKSSKSDDAGDADDD